MTLPSSALIRAAAARVHMVDRHILLIRNE